MPPDSSAVQKDPPWRKHFGENERPFLEFPDLTLSQIFEQTVQKSPQHTALVFMGQEIPYEVLYRQVLGFAAGLSHIGHSKGGRVAIMLPNCPPFVVAFFGTLKIGAVVTSTSPLYTPHEAEHQWNDSGAEILVIHEMLYPIYQAVQSQTPTIKHVIIVGETKPLPPGNEKIQVWAWRQFLGLSTKVPQVDLKPSDVACLQYTGGTTGISKGAILTHKNISVAACQCGHVFRGTSPDSTRIVAVLPLFHVFGLTAELIFGIACNGTVLLIPKFDPATILDEIRKFKPTLFFGVPTMYVALTGLPGVEACGFEKVLCISGGSPLPASVLHAFEKKTGAAVVEGYGMTETTAVGTLNPIKGLHKPGSVGVCSPHSEVKIVDLETGTKTMPQGERGEVLIRGPQVMQGYWNKVEETADILKDGWLYTGDIGYQDEEGYFFLVDRKKDMIIAGGYNIYPREVEEVLFHHPKIQEAVVVGMPDGYRGETVKAFVVLKPGQTVSGDEEIISYCRENLAAYKIPKQIVYRTSLPKSGVGKYLRRELRNSNSN